MFEFSGPILTSKSWLNRAQIIRYFNTEMQINDAVYSSDDVINLKKAIDKIDIDNSFDLGLGGTSFRFFCFLISRKSGDYKIKAAKRLLDRPQQEIINILSQLGVRVKMAEDYLHIASKGWQGNVITCAAGDSSQFVSGLLLSSWNLDFDLKVEVKKPISSRDYLDLTLDILTKSGLKFLSDETDSCLSLHIYAKQSPLSIQLAAEPDVSSVFSLAAAAVVNGNIRVENWCENTVQPDRVFLEVFKEMQIPYVVSNGVFYQKRQESWKSLNFNLKNAPDLFPVLSVLCALAEGKSILYGAENLKFKESNRIEKTAELLKMCGYSCGKTNDGLVIFGSKQKNKIQHQIVFDPDHDHRMAMAAGILKLAGYDILIKNSEVVSKSYPDFWKNTGLSV